MPRPNVGQIALERGEAHFNAWGGLNTGSSEVVQSFIDNADFKVVATTGVVFTAYSFNLRRGFFADKRVRQAWLHALGQEEDYRSLPGRQWDDLQFSADPRLVDPR